MSTFDPINDSDVGFGQLKWEKGLGEWNEIPRKLENEQEVQVAKTTSITDISLPTVLARILPGKVSKRPPNAMLGLCFTLRKDMDIDSVVNGGIFHENHDGLVIVKNIRTSSLCEHHLVPFTGTIHVGYIPNGRLIGISKIARLAEIFARRLQVQERLTNQIAAVIEQVIEPRGVGVIMEASHLCMVMRGVEKTTSTTVSTCMLGCMRSNVQLRDEFLTLLQSKTF
ncbi:hypothetical protein N7456_007092 [Penicillium angulare]|uniref:GTP cyclohydrolase 1 n=1 Tax=Penicillium angulare TaxID=116970 RepID=A0A9W9KC83_9EURO|nr:hypothetical protein N7456_007092 [Penicillium angulare]